MVTLRMAGILGLALVGACSAKATMPSPQEPPVPSGGDDPVTILPRVMVIRVEALTPALEQDDLAALAKLEGDAAARAAGDAHFKSLGRFAEPRLRRAMAQSAPAPVAGTQLLAGLAGADVRGRAGE